MSCAYVWLSVPTRLPARSNERAVRRAGADRQRLGVDEVRLATAGCARAARPVASSPFITTSKSPRSSDGTRFDHAYWTNRALTPSRRAIAFMMSTSKPISCAGVAGVLVDERLAALDVRAPRDLAALLDPGQRLAGRIGARPAAEREHDGHGHDTPRADTPRAAGPPGHARSIPSRGRLRYHPGHGPRAHARQVRPRPVVDRRPRLGPPAARACRATRRRRSSRRSSTWPGIELLAGALFEVQRRQDRRSRRSRRSSRRSSPTRSATPRSRCGLAAALRRPPLPRLRREPVADRVPARTSSRWSSTPRPRSRTRTSRRAS